MGRDFQRRQVLQRNCKTKDGRTKQWRETIGAQIGEKNESTLKQMLQVVATSKQSWQLYHRLIIGDYLQPKEDKSSGKGTKEKVGGFYVTKEEISKPFKTTQGKPITAIHALFPFAPLPEENRKRIFEPVISGRRTLQAAYEECNRIKANILTKRTIDIVLEEENCNAPGTNQIVTLNDLSAGYDVDSLVKTLSPFFEKAGRATAKLKAQIKEKVVNAFNVWKNKAQGLVVASEKASKWLVNPDIEAPTQKNLVEIICGPTSSVVAVKTKTEQAGDFIKALPFSKFT
jgi:hypothetical protein